MDLLLDPFRPVFMQRALLEVLVLAIPAGLLGTWVVLRRLAFLTHAVGHATFPALVIAALAGWSLFGASLVAAVVIALVLAWLSAREGLSGGVGVAIVLSAALAVGAVLVSDIDDPGVRANSLLFGSLLAVDERALLQTGVVAGVVLAAIAVAGRGLALATFDRELAVSDRRHVRSLDLVLLLMLAASVAVSVRIVGSLLVSGLFLVPAATARLVTRRLPAMQVAAVALAAVEGSGGLWLAFRLDAPPGAAIAATTSGVFVVVAAGRALAPRMVMRLIPS